MNKSNICEKYFYIDPEKARKLLEQSEKMSPVKRGIDRRAYLIDEYAVLSTSRLKLRNVIVQDPNLAYFGELINTLKRLREQGVLVVPILGYCYDRESENGDGYILQERAKGEELYDDAILVKYYAWAQKNPQNVYLSSNADAGAYLISRTEYISKIPQRHFDKFMADIIAICDEDILIDFLGKSNFFYDETIGFQFIDLDSHTDYKYGRSKERYDSRSICAYDGFAPCHIAAGSEVYSQIALDEKAMKGEMRAAQGDRITKLDADALEKLAEDNRTIYEKCREAMLANGITKAQLAEVFQELKLFGVS